MSDWNLKKAMAYRRIQEAIKVGLLVENNTGMLYCKEENPCCGELPF